MMTDGFQMWVDRLTGEHRPFGEGQSVAGCSAETHILLPYPEDMFTGAKIWRADAAKAAIESGVDEEAVLAAGMAQAISIPASVTPRQIRLALIQLELDDEVEAYVASLKKAARVEWEYATEIRRDNGLIMAAAAEIGKTPQDLDNLFILAATFK